MKTKNLTMNTMFSRRNTNNRFAKIRKGKTKYVDNMISLNKESIESKFISRNDRYNFIIDFGIRNGLTRQEAAILANNHYPRNIPPRRVVGSKYFAVEKASISDVDIEQERGIVGGVVRREVDTRIGQQQFRQRLMDAYKERCAVTGCRIKALLDAADIVQFKNEKSHSVSNGILLRTDIHRLFDCKLLQISQSGKIYIAEMLKETEYYKLHLKVITFPENQSDRPIFPKLPYV